MSSVYEYDVIVIGGGIAGFVSAVTANSLGKRVAIIEKRKVGGNCTNFTCIPSKALIRSSHMCQEASHLHRMGLQAGPPGGLDTSGVMDRIRTVVQKAYEKDLPETFERIGIRVITGAAAFADGHHVEVDGRTVSAEKFIIAVGTRPLVPPIPGLKEIDYLTNENLYELGVLPGSLIILGGGVDGLEYASAFGRLGVDTTVVEMATRLMPTADRELVNVLITALETDGIRLLTGAKATSLYKERDRVVLTYEGNGGRFGEVQADRVLVSIGRRPDFEGLALDKAGVASTPRGITVDDRLRTSAPNIFACGDIVGPYQLASMAEYQGMIAATNAVLPFARKVDYRNNVYVTFTEPPLAQIGLTEEEAHKKHGPRLKVYRFDYGNMRRAMVDGTETGVAKFLLDGAGRIVGAHILGEGAPDVIHEAQVVKALRAPLRRLHDVTHAYPTYAQALVGRASQLAYLERMAESPLVTRVLSMLPGCDNRLGLALHRLAESELVVHEAVTRNPYAGIAVETFREGSVRVVDLPPELMDYEEEAVVAAGAIPDAGQAGELIFDFTRVRRINGLGAAMLIKLCALARAAGIPTKAFGVTRRLRDILAVTGLEQALRIFATRPEALIAAGVAADGSDGEEAIHDDVVETGPWAKPVPTLRMAHRPDEGRGLNVNGRRTVGPVHGFGQLWQRVFRLHVGEGATTPEKAVAALKQDFADFQPSFNRFLPGPAGIAPGEIVPFDSWTPGGPISTGVVVVYADERSFSFITPEGHPECGIVSFGAYGEAGKTFVEVVGLARAGDPVYEAAFRVAGARLQNRIWSHVLWSLAAHLGVPARITTTSRLVDGALHWDEARRIRNNAQIRTILHEPLWWLKRLWSRGEKK